MKPGRPILIALSLLSGCATPAARGPREWQCLRTVTIGDVVGTSYRNVNPDGTPGPASRNWDWRRSAPEADIAMLQHIQIPAGGNDRPWVVVNPGRPFRGRISDVELSAGDGATRPTDPAFAIHGRQWQYIFVVQLQALLALPRPVAIVAYDRRGRVAFRIAIDVDIAIRGQEAAARADALAVDAMRDYRNVCQPLTNDEDVVIT